MGEMTARERLADAVEDAMIDGWHALEADTPTWKRNAEQSTEAIVAIVRQAMLSEEAVEASISSAGNEFIGVRADAEDMLAAALDAAFGPGND